MEWSEWEPIYERILREMGYSRERDEEAARLLNDLISDRAMSFAELKLRLGGGVATVFGAGPSLPQDLEEFLNARLLGHTAIIAADGAAAPLLEKGITPHVVVTDLDGGDEVLLRASREESVLVVHAHGDNLDALRRLVPLFEGPVMGTTQAKPFGSLYNFGGFTDGDRAVYLAGELGFDTIILAGMDFGAEVGECSKRGLSPEEVEVKLRKLGVGKMLLEEFASSFGGSLYNATRGGEEITGFRRVSFKELGRLLGNIYSRPWGLWRPRGERG